MSQVPAIEVKELTVQYQQKPVLVDVDFTIPQGKTVGIIGPNGAGKSTLMKAVLELVDKSAGEVKFFGDSLARKRLAIAYVPQRGEVDWDFPIDVYDTVMMGRLGHLPLFKRPGAADHAIVEKALNQVELWDFKDRQISQLSGGQQQRVFIARALAQEAQVYLMDEPFVGVDMATERAIIGLFHQLKAQGKTIVVVHHDLNSVVDYFDWLLMLNVRLIAQGPTQEVFTREALQKTYGGRLALLTEVTEKVHQAQIKED
jgi:manganese/zinc/iron transport system ATP- binding protein